MKYEINGVLAIKDQKGCNVTLERMHDGKLRKELAPLLNEFHAVLVTKETESPYYSFRTYVPDPLHLYLNRKKSLVRILESYACYPLLLSYSERNTETNHMTDIDLATPSDGVWYSLNQETGQEEMSDKENPHLIKELLYNYSYSIPYHKPVSIAIN
ncbi:hypothetical protein [Listeria goaensis]|uniref:hypothetical protein n=1 Tax=Listeria goaensis TaxID=1649188 RepID=UPI000B594464|nr:hypothetical protein [Listeria goaensis]